MYLSKEALLQSLRFLIAKPPSDFGMQISSNETLAPPFPRAELFQRNCLKMHLIFRRTAAGKEKTLAQNAWMEWRTDLISWSLPAKERNLWVQDWTLAVIRLINSVQSVLVNLEEMIGTPRYRLGSLPSWKPNVDRIFLWEEEPPDRKTSLLFLFGTRPLQEKNVSRLLLRTTADFRFARQNRKTSSVKKRWESLVDLHLQKNLKSLTEVLRLMMPEKTSITRVNR